MQTSKSPQIVALEHIRVREACAYYTALAPEATYHHGRVEPLSTVAATALILSVMYRL
jgi:hypothetical protein